MKAIIRNLLAVMLLVAASFEAHSQGTLVYDQQSATNGVSPFANNVDGLSIQTEPLTQSFIPAFSAVGFIQLEFEDVPSNGNNGATVYVNMWTGSPNVNAATFLGSTTPVYMPNGFVNSGLGVAGITNFFFLTPITLTPSQTYYLQPVVQSGDNPWAVVAIGNTYPNGQLFASGGGFNSDLWFREGIVSVPEPTTLALEGLSSLLAFGFKRRSKLFVLLGFGTLLLSSSYAQTTSAQSSDTIVQATAEAQGLQLVSPDQLPKCGTFWLCMSGGNGINILPVPCPPVVPMPIYDITGDGQQFLVDGTVGSQPFLNTMQAARLGVPATAQSALTLQANAVANLIAQVQANVQMQQMHTLSRAMGIRSFDDPGGSGGGYSPAFTIDTNGLWLEIVDYNPADTNLQLVLHNTSDTNLYQLESATNLTSTNWDIGELLWGDFDSDETWFTPVARTQPVRFYRAHHANAIMQNWTC